MSMTAGKVRSASWTMINSSCSKLILARPGLRPAGVFPQNWKFIKLSFNTDSHNNYKKGTSQDSLFSARKIRKILTTPYPLSKHPTWRLGNKTRVALKNWRSTSYFLTPLQWRRNFYEIDICSQCSSPSLTLIFNKQHILDINAGKQLSWAATDV
jgi:hypothetical protein